MANQIPLLPTTVVGSYALPAWLHTADEKISSNAYGPTDIQETLDDAVMMAVRDQEEAGIDIISDGEMKRRGFVQSLFRRISNLKDLGPPRKVGESGFRLQAIGR